MQHPQAGASIQRPRLFWYIVSPLENVIANEDANPEPRTPHVRKKRVKPGPLSIERVLPSYVVLLNDGRPVIMRRATSTDDARRKVQALLDEGKL